MTRGSVLRHLWVSPAEKPRWLSAARHPRATWRDPVTGDMMTTGERAAWAAQGFFRRWTVMAAIQAICVAWLLLGDDTARTWWNYTWSDLAIVIENVTMLALFSQARRDAVKIRRIERLEEQQITSERRITAAVTKLSGDVAGLAEAIRAALLRGKETHEQP